MTNVTPLRLEEGRDIQAEIDFDNCLPTGRLPMLLAFAGKMKRMSNRPTRRPLSGLIASTNQFGRSPAHQLRLLAVSN